MQNVQHLTPDYVNSATGLELHQYKWLENEELIGKIDEKWNWLVESMNIILMLN